MRKKFFDIPKYSGIIILFAPNINVYFEIWKAIDVVTARWRTNSHERCLIFKTYAVQFW